MHDTLTVDYKSTTISIKSTSAKCLFVCRYNVTIDEYRQKGACQTATPNFPTVLFCLLST